MMFNFPSLGSLAGASWLQKLQPASFNGIIFFVDESTYSTGRRVAVHEYPFRDNPYVEDLGLNRRNITIRGFLVGNDCYAQRDKLKTACEKGGGGRLIHPSMGLKTVALVAAGFSEDKDKGRVVAVNFDFLVVDDKPRWPAKTKNTLGGLLSSIKNFISAITDTFQSAVSSVLHVVGEVLSVVHSFVNLCSLPIREASAIFGVARGLFSIENPFSLGRFTGNFTNNFSSNIHSRSGNISTSARMNLNVADAITTAATLRQNTTVSHTSLLALAYPLNTVDTTNFTTVLQKSIETLRTTINDPNDQIRMLSILAQFTVTPLKGDKITGPTAALIRRMVLGSLATSSSKYTPNSQTDALTLIAKIRPLFDAEITYAADNGDTAAYVALRDLRSSVMLDLQTRGSTLPPLITISTKDRLPSLMLAWNLYSDATRETDLVNRNPDVIHPLFMPTNFEALSI